MRPLATITAGVIALGAFTAVSAAGPAQAASATFTNSAAIPINDAATSTSTLTVASYGGAITDVDVTVHNVSHAWTDDIDLYLRAPGQDGVAVKLLSDQCGGGDLVSATLTFNDEAAGQVPATGCGSGAFQPTDVAAGADNTPAGLSVASTLAAFDGLNPVGTWTLYAVDDTATISGTITGGFSVKITTGPAAINIPTASGPASPYPFELPVSGTPGNVTDVDVRLGGVHHTWPDDMEVLLVAPSGASTILVSDVCGSGDVTGSTWRFDDSAAAPLADAGPCPSGSYRPSNVGAGDTFEVPAPAAPYGESLGALNGSPANGTWRLFVREDGSPDGGFITDVDLLITTDAPGNTTISTKPRKVSKARKATVAFSADKAGVTFQCKVDKKAWKACSSPLKLKKLKPGKHKVLVRSVGSGGAVESTPAVAKWRVRR